MTAQSQTKTQAKTQAETEPIFQAPWEARAFALVNQLATCEQWSWAEWTDYLAQEIALANPDVSDPIPYYVQWVEACEKLLIAKGLLGQQAIDQKVKELQAEQQSDHSHLENQAH